MTVIRRVWTDDDLRKLRSLWGPAINADPRALDRARIEAIAKELDRPTGAVYQRARDIGLLPKVAHWSGGAKAVEAAHRMSRDLKGSLGAHLKRRAANEPVEHKPGACLHKPYLLALLAWDKQRLACAREGLGPWGEMDEDERRAEVRKLTAAVAQVRSQLERRAG